MISAKFGSETVGVFYGLTQWDYGQLVQIQYKEEVPDEVEVQIYQKDLQYGTTIEKSAFYIPDECLKSSSEIKAFIYLNTATSGKTILVACFPVKSRPKPDDYIEPKPYEGYKRLLPIGGNRNQVPVRIDDALGSVEWGDRADKIELNDSVLSLMSGDVELSRVRLPVGLNGREIELKNTGTEIQWRYTDSNDWMTLVDLESIRGPAGETPEFEIREGHLFAIYEK